MLLESASISYYQRIRGFTTMRYINRLFTYLLNYILSEIIIQIGYFLTASLYFSKRGAY